MIRWLRRIGILPTRIYAFDFWNTLVYVETGFEVRHMTRLLRKVYRQGHEVHIVSAISPELPLANPMMFRAKVKGYHLPFTAIHLTDHNPAEKVEVLRRIGADYFYDDLTSNIAAAQAAGFRAILVQG